MRDIVIYDPVRPRPEEAFRTVITLTNPAPISINEAFTVARDRKILTNKGRTFKAALATATARSSMQWKIAEQAVYQEGGWVELHVLLALKSVYNKSWSPMSRTKKNNLRNPYQQYDVSNYLKLIEDAVVMGCGIDDANHMDIHLYKREDQENPRVEVIYQVFI